MVISSTKNWPISLIVAFTIVQAVIIFALMLYGKNRRTILAITGIVHFETIIIGGAITANHIIVQGTIGIATFDTFTWGYWMPKMVLWALMVILVAGVGISIHLLGEEQKKHAIEFKQLWVIVLIFEALTIALGTLIGFHAITVNFLG